VKVINLNTWCGRAGKEKLLNFLKNHKETDIFCLQEIFSIPNSGIKDKELLDYLSKNPLTMKKGKDEISKILPNHESYFHPTLGNDYYGLQMLIKNKIKHSAVKDLFVYKERGAPSIGDIRDHARNIQYTTIETPKGKVTVINVHGLWSLEGKGDTESRLEQSEKILDLMKKLKGEVILCGDFNLLPETESIKLFEKAGLRNLIREYKVKSTRTSYYKKPEEYADYIFVSKDINVKEFRVLPEEVSDHVPLFLDFEIKPNNL